MGKRAEVADRVGQFLTALQQGTEADVENIPPELRKDHALLFHKKAEIEDLKSLAATKRVLPRVSCACCRRLLALA